MSVWQPRKGDRVRVIAEGEYKGKTGIVDEVTTKTEWAITVALDDEPDWPLMFDADELEGERG